MQAAGDDLQAALDDKDEAFESVTALLDDTLEQADIALDEAKRALQQGPTSAPNQACIPLCCTDLTRRVNQATCQLVAEHANIQQT